MTIPALSTLEWGRGSVFRLVCGVTHVASFGNATRCIRRAEPACSLQAKAHEVPVNDKHRSVCLDSRDI